MHGFCTDFARFQTVQMVQIVAKLDKGCRNCWVKNYVALIKNNDNSKLPETETNRRLALLISGPRVRVPGGAPDIERQIVRFGVLSLCRKAAAHFLHTVCTFARIGGFSAQGLSLWMTTPNCWHCCVSSCAAQATPNDVPRNTNCYKTARPPGSRRPCHFVLYFAKSGSCPRPHSATLTGRTYTPSAA